MKALFFLTTILLFNSTLFSQALSYQWVKNFGGSTTSDLTTGKCIKTDASGNVYTVGYFNGTNDFDPGVGTFTLSSFGSEDIFISKTDALGNFLWAKRVGGSGVDEPYELKFDASGNLYIVGYFEGSVDFNPSSGVFNMSSAGGTDGYILKLDATGAFVWAKKIGGVSDDYIVAIDIDASGNFYITGSFVNTVDLNPGTGVANFTSITSGNCDVFVSKYDATGNYIWAKTIVGASVETPSDIKVDALGNIYSIGTYYNNIDLDPSTAVVGFTTTAFATESYISKLDGSGNYVWGERLISSTEIRANALDIDNTGNVYIVGEFSGTGDFNPGSGIYNLTSVSNDGSTDIFVLKLSSTGLFQWVDRMWGAGYDRGNSIMLDASNNIYVTGIFTDITDFDSSTGVFNLTCAGWSASFVLKLNALGDFIWAGKMGGTDFTTSYGINVDQLGTSLYTTGYFINASDFDPSSSVANLTPSGYQDAFVLKLCIPPSSVTVISGTNTIAAGGTATYTVSTVSGASGYFWTVPAGAVINFGQNTPTISVTFASTSGSIIVTPTNSCGSAASTSQFVSIIGTCLPTIAISTPSTTICSSSAIFTSTITNGGSSPIYQWKKNGISVGSGLTSYSPTSLVNGDVISCLLTSNLSCASPSVVISNSVTVTVGSSTLVPTILVSTITNTICSGTTAVFSSTVSNGGTLPSYQWKKNGTNVGTGLTSYSPTSLVNGDIVSCILTSNLSCITASVVPSNSITMTVFVCTAQDNISDSDYELLLYPNPINDFLNIEISNYQNYVVSLVDEIGRVLFEGKDTKYIETNSFSNGVYYLKIESKTFSKIKKVIIAK